MCRGNDEEVRSILLSGLSSGVLSFDAAERRLPEAAFRPAPLAASTSSANRRCSDAPGTWRVLCFDTPRPVPDAGVPSDALDGPGSDAPAPSTLGRREYDGLTSSGTLCSATSPEAACEEEEASFPLPGVLCLAPILPVCYFSIFRRI